MNTRLIMKLKEADTELQLEDRPTHVTWIQSAIREAIGVLSKSPSSPIGAELKKIEGFTPGPWVSKGIHIMMPGKTGSQAQAFRQDVTIGITDTEALANATLIAYAPELYQLASQYRDECDRLREEVARRQQLILSEPNGIVRETMIANLLTDL